MDMAQSGRLKTMEPDPVWDADAHEGTVETLAALGDDVVFRVWGGDWCKDCRALLPEFGAALAAAEIPDER
ncbi:MAG: thioredoxin, partial [Halorientalis sp.]